MGLSPAGPGPIPQSHRGRPPALVSMRRPVERAQVVRTTWALWEAIVRIVQFLAGLLTPIGILGVLVASAGLAQLLHAISTHAMP